MNRKMLLLVGLVVLAVWMQNRQTSAGFIGPPPPPTL